MKFSNNLKNNLKNNLTNWNDSDYRVVIKELRHFFTGYDVAGGYDLRSHDLTKSLTQYQKRKVREQFRYIDHIQSGVPKRIYRAKSKKNIDLILRAQGATYIPRNLKVAFVPDISEGKTKVRYIKPKKVVGYDKKKKRATVLIELASIETITMGVTRRYIHINRDFLLHDTLDAINEAMSLADADFYSIQAGADHEVQKDEYKIKRGDTAKDIEEKIKKLQLKYNDKIENNYWGNWLGGLVAYYFKTEYDYEEYNLKRAAEKMRNRKERRKERLRIRRIKELIASLQREIDGLIKKLNDPDLNPAYADVLNDILQKRINRILNLKMQIKGKK